MYTVFTPPTLTLGLGGISFSNQIKFYLLKTHHILTQQLVNAVDEQGQQGSEEQLQ